MPNEDLR
ncbi:hypothetical protein VTH06DRAFT_4222 [Thermothelomyces fergusii]